MSLVLPPLYHWSPESCRRSIIRHGLKPTTPTATILGPPIRGTRSAREYDPEASSRCVCLGTSPSHAWHLSGDMAAERGDVWDLWQVVLDEEDEVYPLSFYGYRLDEFRVANRIPKRRVWWVASRTVA